MLTKRIIACLDIRDGRTVKGTHFLQLRDAGDPVELAARYCEEGADELVLLDITATHEKRKTLTETVSRVAAKLNIPFTVGGGISNADDVLALLQCGADKVSVNSAAVLRPALIQELSDQFGSQCIVAAVDIRYQSGNWWVAIQGGRIITERKAIDWCDEAAYLGAGEILLTSMEHDGAKKGFANEITGLISDRLQIPVIASGGAGCREDFAGLFTQTNAAAALAAGIFHFGELSIPDLKKYLQSQKIQVRL